MLQYTSMYEEIRVLLKGVLKELGVQTDEIHIERPADFSHGDFASNVAMQYAPKAKKNPRKLADEIVSEIQKKLSKEIEKVEVAGPGFINFYLSKEYFANKINTILKEGEVKKDKNGNIKGFGKNKSSENKKVIIEYTDPNPFKEFHIGHLMSNAIGESLARVVEFSGAEVKRANYQGDVGLHVAKAIGGLIEKIPDLKETVGKISDYEFGKKIFEAYSYGSKLYEENEVFKERVNKINKLVYEKSDNFINEIYSRGREGSLDGFEILYKVLGTKFDFYFFESKTSSIGLKIVAEHSDIFEKSDGAVIFRAEKFDTTLHTRVFVTKEELPTYEAKELGLAKMKYEKYPYDISFVVTGNEVKDYFRVVHKAMEQIFPELAEKTKHIPHGMLRLPTGKMSSRTGNVISAVSLLSEVRQGALLKMQNTDLKNKEEVAEQVAVGAVKYSVLRSSAGSDIIFDIEKSISFEGDSGPYLQYTHARANSVIENAQREKIKPSVKKIPQKITDVEKLLDRFPEIVVRAYEEHEPHYIATYLIQLAGAFNAFYAKERIVDAGEEAPYRLALTKATATVLKNGLWLLGIEAPEKM
ncbi:MAG: arginine--tRNA ligase [Parcubacteria group bacterium]|nr:arginine--tRNA ligase [Parcubacteria group bacterium]